MNINIINSEHALEVNCYSKLCCTVRWMCGNSVITYSNCGAGQQERNEREAVFT